MEHIKILANGNRVTNSSVLQKNTTETAENFTLRFVFGGSENCTIGRRQLSIHNDSFVAINKGTNYTARVDADTPVSVFSISFDDDFLEDFRAAWLGDDELDDDATQHLSETIYSFKGEMRAIVTQFKDYMENCTPDNTVIDEYITRCLLCYFEIYHEEILQKAANLNFLHYNTRIEILRRLNLAKEYLYANYSRNINLENLADHACLSVNHLLRTFKLAYNQSPHQFLIQLRLQRAQSLLTKTEYPIYEIVNMVGFKCTSSFIRLFRTRYKTTPLKYRNVIAA
ncbi:MAG: helix-turn-helix transcriptional regulator [Bacteroidetes bacterium]|nr:helix-turn-helix transcriptional regulator [Bacteroidota bacterium]